MALSILNVWPFLCTKLCILCENIKWQKSCITLFLDYWWQYEQQMFQSDISNSLIAVFLKAPAISVPWQSPPHFVSGVSSVISLTEREKSRPSLNTARLCVLYISIRPHRLWSCDVFKVFVFASVYGSDQWEICRSPFRPGTEISVNICIYLTRIRKHFVLSEEKDEQMHHYTGKITILNIDFIVLHV